MHVYIIDQVLTCLLGVTCEITVTNFGVALIVFPASQDRLLQELCEQRGYERSLKQGGKVKA